MWEAEHADDESGCSTVPFLNSRIQEPNMPMKDSNTFILCIRTFVFCCIIYDVFGVIIKNSCSGAGFVRIFFYRNIGGAQFLLLRDVMRSRTCRWSDEFCNKSHWNLKMFMLDIIMSFCFRNIQNDTFRNISSCSKFFYSQQ